MSFLRYHWKQKKLVIIYHDLGQCRDHRWNRQRGQCSHHWMLEQMLLVNLTGKQNTRSCNSQERQQLTSSSQQEDSSQLTEKLGQHEWQHVHWYTSLQDHQPPTLLWPAHWNELGTSQALPLSTAVSPNITQEKKSVFGFWRNNFR